MAVFRPEYARYNSFQEFLSFTKDKDNSPSFSNLFSVSIATPAILRRGAGTVTNGNLEIKEDLALLLDYYADSVQLPSKQITTGQVGNVGSSYKYATNTAYSQMQITFRLPRSQQTRNLFERWTQVMASDADQYTRFYNEYCCPEFLIYKWERGGGDYVYTDPKMIRALREAGNSFLLARKYELTACWRMVNVFPYNIGSIRLDNAAAKTLTMTVGFYYERYRFYPRDKFDINLTSRAAATSVAIDNAYIAGETDSIR